MKQYINLLSISIVKIPILTLCFLLLTCICFCALAIIILLLILDKMYRPELAQYPFNFILDRIIPISVLFLPVILVFVILPDNVSIIFLEEHVITITWFSRYVILLFLHVFIIIPIVDFWSNLRSWKIKGQGDKNYITWDQPILYKHIAIALIYPLIWGIYFSLIRYIRLGTEINVIKLIYIFNIELLIIVLFLSPFIVIWLKLIVCKMLTIRRWYWSELCNLVLTLHLYLIRYNIYFFIGEKVYKFAFILGTFVSISHVVFDTKKKYPYYRQLLQDLYFRPYWGFLLVLEFCVIELLWRDGVIYYSLYVLFIYPIIYSMIYLLYNIYTMFWIDQVCTADYFVKNWENPRYPHNFWVSFLDNSERMGFDWQFSPEETKYLATLAKPYLSKKYGCSFLLPMRIRNHPYIFRLKTGYKMLYAVRWVHTFARPIHSATAFFVRNYTERIVLIQQNWKHLAAILKAENLGYTTQNVQPNCYINFQNKGNNFLELLEQNVQTNFLPLAQEGVVFNKYHNQKIDNKNQPQPDLVADFSQSSFKDKFVHGLDQKSSVTSSGYCEILSGISEPLYIKKLNKLQGVLSYKNSTTSNIYGSSRDPSVVYDADAIAKTLNKLKQSSCDLTNHQLIWAQNIHYFPDHFLPPIKVPYHFSIENLQPEFLLKIKKAGFKVEKISEFLYLKKVPEYYHGDSMPVEALSYLQGSELQKLLDEN